MKLPDVHQAILDQETLSAYFLDLDQAAQVLEVRAKGHEALRANESTLDLLRGRVLFEGKDVASLQIRYNFEGIEWWDTLSWIAGEIRLVRIGHDWSKIEESTST
jgi:hypothetical protein